MIGINTFEFMYIGGYRQKNFWSISLKRRERLEREERERKEERDRKERRER
jgi:hypothetical protein